MDKLHSTQREKIQQISVSHTMDVLGGRIGLVFYDVTTLYSESAPDPADMFKSCILCRKRDRLKSRFFGR